MKVIFIHPIVVVFVFAGCAVGNFKGKVASPAFGSLELDMGGGVIGHAQMSSGGTNNPSSVRMRSGQGSNDVAHVSERAP